MHGQLTVGAVCCLINIAIHAAIMAWVVTVARRAARATASLGAARHHIAVMSATVLVLLIAHALEVGVWALMYRLVHLVPTEDTFYFAFGAPKVREVDATVGGIRVLEIPDSGMAAARKIFPEGYLSPAAPGPFFIGVDKPMGVYTWDNLLFTNAKVKDEQVYKIIEAMAKNKDDLVAIQPALRSFTAAGLYKNYGVPYHPGALKYFNDNKIEPTTTR